MPVRLDQYNHPQGNNHPQPNIYPPPIPHMGMRETTRNLGFYNPYLDTGKKKGSSLGWAMVWLVFAVVGLTLAGLIVLGAGLGVAIVGTISAVIPAFFYLPLFLWLDRYDPEPPGKLIFAYVWGAVISVFIAAIVNSVVQVLFGEAWAVIVSAPIVEEGAKGFCLLIVMLFFRRDFDSVVDGIVYAGVVALGFATVENIEYYGRSLSSGPVSLGVTLFLRGVLSPYAHVLFTCMTGIGFGIARETHNKALKFAAPAIGYSIAVFLHALWNSLATLGGMRLFLVGYVLIEVPLFCVFLGVIIYLVRREGQILKQALAVEVKRGLITQNHLDIAISVFRRTIWLASAIGKGGLYSARRQFLRAIAKLGLCHWHVQRAAQAGGQTQSFPLINQFQAEVFSLRHKV